MNGESVEGLQKYVNDVLALDKHFNLEHLHDLNTGNLLFMSNALGGEVGEVQNIVKKIVRDGATDKLWSQLDEELVDVLIYFIELLVVVRSKFDEAWEAKHKVLYERFAHKIRPYEIDINIKLERS